MKSYVASIKKLYYQQKVICFWWIYNNKKLMMSNIKKALKMWKLNFKMFSGGYVQLDQSSREFCKIANLIDAT